MLAYGSIIFDIYRWHHVREKNMGNSWYQLNEILYILFLSFFIGQCSVNDVYQIVLSFCPSPLLLCPHFRSKLKTSMYAMLSRAKERRKKLCSSELENSIYSLSRVIQCINVRVTFANNDSNSNEQATFIELIFIKNGLFANVIVFSWISMATLFLLWTFNFGYSTAAKRVLKCMRLDILNATSFYPTSETGNILDKCGVSVQHVNGTNQYCMQLMRICYNSASMSF